MAHVRLICGGYRSDRARTLDALMAEHWESAIFLAPTRRAATLRSERLILAGERPGTLGRKVTTFQDFVAGLLASEHSATAGIDECERRLLLERAVNRLRGQGELDALGDAAASAGFLSHALRVISDLKQAAIDPDEFRARVTGRKRPAPMDAVVATVYDAYQASLRDVNAYDNQGLYWEAHLICQRGRPRSLSGIQVLLLDGFDDFTPSEFRLLESLAPYLEHLVFGFDCDPERPSRRDLDAIPLETMNRLRERFGAELVTLGEPEPKTHTEFAASHLFWRDKPAEIEGLSANLELLPCVDALHEIETIGRRVKTLLLDGIPAEEIAVVFRDATSAMATVRSIFSEFGVPVIFHERPALSDSAIATYIMSALDAFEDWKREDIVAVLTSPWFAPPEGVTEHTVSAAPTISRFARIVEGFNEWESRLQRLADSLERGEQPAVKELTRRLPNASDAVRDVLASIRVLNDISKGLGSSASSAEFARRLDLALQQMRVAEALPHAVPENVRDTESNALLALRGLLGTIEQWYSAEDQQVAITRTEFVSRLRQLLRTASYTYPQPRHGVACLSMQALRGLSFGHVFLCGVNEGEMPRAAALNAIYSDEDIEDLREAGIGIEGRRRQNQREVRLFQHAFEAVRIRLCLTWRTVGRNGAEALPSPYVADVLELFPYLRTASGVVRALDITPSLDSVASWRDLRNAAFARNDGVRDLFKGEFAFTEFGVALEKRRHTATPFDAFDGVLAAPAQIAAIAQRYGAAHSFSVNQIETYLGCPFRFFMERILDIEEAETPVAEFDDLVRGLILHSVLERFHRHFMKMATAEIPEVEAEKALRGIVDDVFDARAWLSVNAPVGVVEIEKRRMTIQASRYLRLCRERNGDTAWKPSHFEVAFGRSETTAADPLSQSEPFPLETEIGAVQFSGRIDRIDLRDQDARIVDYKTSYAPRQKDIAGGNSIQLSIYALALEEYLRPGVNCAEAYFIPVGKKSWVEALGKSKGAWEARSALARSQVAKAVTGIRSGRFAPLPLPGQCERCTARRPCRYEAGRVERKSGESHGQNP